jgi:lysophospholipase L1-like esterase
MKKLILLISAILLISTSAIARPRTLWMVGDGGMAHYNDSLGACGWVQEMEGYWNKHMTIVNDAAIGMSIRTFISNDGIKQVEKKPNRTIMFVQLGTNDLKEYNVGSYSSLDAFNRSLIELIDLAYKAKVNVVLCTPLAQPFYHEGKLINRLGAYAEAIRRVGQHKHVAVIDLEKTTHEWLASMTPEEAAQYYVSLNAEVGEFQLNAAGAAVVANMAKQAIQESSSKKLRKVVKKEK